MAFNIKVRKEFMNNAEIHQAVQVLRKEVVKWKIPAVSQVAGTSNLDPFKILIACLLSLRTQDQTTAKASERLFALAATPDRMKQLSEQQIIKAIYPVGFYRNKARQILKISKDILEKHNGRVPATIEELIKLEGVGRKTANLVITVGYGQPGICVDTHVHRICNRWGYVKTKTPEQTEKSLRAKLPREYWIELNDLLVTFGQQICRPLSPKCSQCPLEKLCRKLGVTKSR